MMWPNAGGGRRRGSWRGKTSVGLLAACLVAAGPLASAGVGALADEPVLRGGYGESQWPGTPAMCPDEVILVARGSSEAPQPPTDPVSVTSYTAETGWGLGGPGTIAAGAVQGKMNRAGLTSRRQGVVYPALPVPTKPRDVEAYLASIKAGADAIVDAVGEYVSETACPGDPSVNLIGYSQGAWSVRIAVREMAKRWGDPCCHGMWFMGSVLLFGDPTYDSTEEISRWGYKPPRGRDLGIAHAAGITKLAPKSWFAPYSDMIRHRVSSYCLVDDSVCRTPHRWGDLGLRLLLPLWTARLEGHLAYGGDEMAAAAKFASRTFQFSTAAVRQFAQQALDSAAAGDEDWLWENWAEDSYDYWPDEMVADMGGLPGVVDGCSMVYGGRCLVWLEADPGVRWNLTMQGDLFAGEFRVGGLTPAP